MKIKLSILFISALVLASGCARKCPPCPMSTGSYGTGSSYAAAPGVDAAPMNSAPATSDSTSAYGSTAGARYVSK